MDEAKNRERLAKRVRQIMLRLIVTLCVILLLYVVSYAVLSAAGGYALTQSGETRWSPTGLAVSDVLEWQPLGAKYHRQKSLRGGYLERENAIGHCYRPLIRLDRRFIHKTKRVVELNGDHDAGE